MGLDRLTKNIILCLSYMIPTDTCHTRYLPKSSSLLGGGARSLVGRGVGPVGSGELLLSAVSWKQYTVIIVTFRQENFPKRTAPQNVPKRTSTKDFPQRNSHIKRAQENTPTKFSQGNFPTGLFQRNDPTRFWQENYPIELFQQNFPKRTAPRDFPQENFPIKLSQENLPTELTPALDTASASVKRFSSSCSGSSSPRSISVRTRNNSCITCGIPRNNSCITWGIPRNNSCITCSIQNQKQAAV